MAPVHAAPKPITKTFTFVDRTPDPTGNAASSEAEHCRGQLPTEQPAAFKAPAAGKLKVSIKDFVGDWTLQVRDAKGKTIGGVDVNPPDFESVTVKIKGKGDYGILPCNLTGSFEATVTYVFTYA